MPYDTSDDTDGIYISIYQNRLMTFVCAVRHQGDLMIAGVKPFDRGCTVYPGNNDSSIF